LLPLLLLLPPLPLSAQRRARPSSRSASWLAQRIAPIIIRAEADRAFWGIEVYAPARGQTLYSLNAHRYFTPASVTKLFTTAAALTLLGPDHQFRTTVETPARIDAYGRLLGDLILVGRGDPNLSGRPFPYTAENQERENWDPPTVVLEQLADQVVAAGVRIVAGDIVADDSFFAPERYPSGWSLGDVLWGYGAPVTALALNDNTITLRVEPGERVGEPARLTWEPYVAFYRAANRIVTGEPGSRTEISLRREPGTRAVALSGTIAADHSGRALTLAIEDPTEFAATLFRALLELRGVRVDGSVRVRRAIPTVEAPEVTAAAENPPAPSPSRRPDERTVLAEHLSLPLVEDIKLILKESQNLHAEMLLRLLGRQLPPPAPGLQPRELKPYELPPRLGNGSAEAGLEVLRALLANAGVNPNDVELYDGSGLARRNLLTPHAVVQWLKFIQAQPWRPLLADALPRAGLDGTLKDRMKNGPARARIQAKTGTLAHTNALAGFAQTVSGEPLLFAIFVNHHTLANARALALLDAICNVLVQLPPATRKKTEKGN
ncbi:MAG: D-alanyl-D-alanine carboxypeptidase/D-alanyl-D-alanine-endopeptidase, partial [Terriglobia bacterium]